MPQNFYELVWIFIIYAFIGWCTEVSYAALDRGIFVNRGFLNGPYCPIYGCGVLIVVVLLTPLKKNLLILYLGSFLLTSVLEFITGFVMEKVFHNKWWDYSDKPFNIMGYVCLKFSILGIGMYLYYADYSSDYLRIHSSDTAYCGGGITYNYNDRICH